MLCSFFIMKSDLNLVKEIIKGARYEQNSKEDYNQYDNIISCCFNCIIRNKLFYSSKTKSKILTEEQAKELEDVDCILVLGAGIWGQKPSPMLEDRLLQGISLYQNGVSQKLL